MKARHHKRRLLRVMRVHVPITYGNGPMWLLLPINWRQREYDRDFYALLNGGPRFYALPGTTR